MKIKLDLLVKIPSLLGVFEVTLMSPELKELCHHHLRQSSDVTGRILKELDTLKTEDIPADDTSRMNC